MSFNPYRDNGGTILAIPGEKFCIAAGDTRMSIGYSIQTRHGNKLTRLTDTTVIVSAGMQSDTKALHKLLKTRLTLYEHDHGKQMSTQAIAQMLSNILYGKRFFPYYTFNLVAGLDENGDGAVYGYDAIGSYERLKAGAQGTGQSLVQPLLDNQITFNNQTLIPKNLDLGIDGTLNLVKDSFSSAGERDIYTGDSVDIAIITEKGITMEKFELKKD
jgi:20S proteasome subunit beta 6